MLVINYIAAGIVVKWYVIDDSLATDIHHAEDEMPRLRTLRHQWLIPHHFASSTVSRWCGVRAILRHTNCSSVSGVVVETLHQITDVLINPSPPLLVSRISLY